ncbi:alpha/beta family hydrolase [Thalassotalea mangrovi]|uniref:alpha/beta family hydrolase n=1 Tax=Thalassotalea mangrovi TaxID=2572245 RepID=UPI001FE699E0|nr:alpha/beta family hydrolase [Thalassotalea mangrovi]
MFDFTQVESFDRESVTLDKTNDAGIATMIFAHGAGADKDSEFIRQVIARLNENGVHVLSFNFPYMQQRKLDGKRRPPNRMPALQQAFSTIIEAYRGELPFFIGGKSMGSRVAMTLIADDKVRAGFCFGYPFHPQKKPESLRLEPLQQQQKPVLIMQGQRDALGNEQEVLSYQLGQNIEVRFYPDGDHDLKPRVKSGYTHKQHIEQSCTDLINFVNRLTIKEHS